MISPAAPLGLGSRSPRRKELLETLQLPVLIIAADVDERVLDGELPDSYLKRVTLLKWRAAAADERASRTGALIAADTSVIVDGEVLGKPKDIAHAETMLRRLSGRAHEVRTRFAVGTAVGAPRVVHEETVTTRVHFRTLDASEIQGYAATGEGADKAGAYAIQGIGSCFVMSIEGSYSNVVGLPVCEVVVALKKHGYLVRLP